MDQTYPKDADGDALRRVAEGGSDMSKPMEIDFHIAFEKQAGAEAVAEAAAKIGYSATVYRDEEDDLWTCECSKEMLATYDGVIAAQSELDALSAPHGGHGHGWGTFGNVEEDKD